MKWQYREPTERNENIVFWINRNRVNLHRMWAKAAFPAVLFRQCSGIFFKPAWQCFLHCGWFLKNRLYLLFTQASLTERAFPKRPASPTFSYTHFAPLGAKVSPLLFTEHFYLTSRVLIALLRVTSTKVTWECAGFFLLLCPHVPSSGIWRNSNPVKSPILWAALMVGAEIGRQWKAFWVGFRFFCITLWMTCSPCSIGVSQC